jgi:hypothetical protein
MVSLFVPSAASGVALAASATPEKSGKDANNRSVKNKAFILNKISV